jgi:hypothetical protein
MGSCAAHIVSPVGISQIPHKTAINSISERMRETSKRDEDSGVVQQAGHAALDRRIGVRIPAPELIMHCIAPQGARGEAPPIKMSDRGSVTAIRYVGPIV